MRTGRERGRKTWEREICERKKETERERERERESGADGETEGE